jgi:electron transfer flavoprotein alpha subunit
VTVTSVHRGATQEPLELSRLAVIVSRDGVLPAGAAEVAAEAGGRVLLLGSGTAKAAADLGAPRAWQAETAGAAPAGLSAALVPLLRNVRLLLLPASPDGRDLAPRLAAALDRPLLACATRAEVDDEGVTAVLARLETRLEIEVHTAEPAVVTLLPGSRNPLPPSNGEVFELLLDVPAGVDAVRLAVLEPDPETMDLAEADRVVGAGAGLGPDPATFALLTGVATRLGASAGATRVLTDAGLVSHDRQIGTTGVTISPELYLALGVAGASQHTGGLGSPRHVVSVNTDPSCPMTAMADLGLVTDARALLEELADRLGVPRG